MEKGCNCETCEIRKQYLRLRELIDSGQLSLHDARVTHELLPSVKDGEDLFYNGAQLRHSDR